MSKNSVSRLWALDQALEFKSFQEVFAKYRGVGPGFDLLRLGLALAIFYGHANWCAGRLVTHVADNGSDLTVLIPAIGGWSGPTRPFHVALVPMFFALSGFLVTGSAFRLRSIARFFAFRGLRIFPALAVEVTLSALILGPIFTTLPTQAYFTDAGFFRYFGNIVGFITFFLPGVFTSNPVHGIVNMNLWTLPSEFYCYLLTALAMYTGVIYNKKLFSILFVAATGGLLLASLVFGFGVVPNVYPTHAVVYYFFAGCAFYHWMDRIRFNYMLFALACIGSYVLLLYQSTIYIAPFLVTYVTVSIGTFKFPKNRILESGDYSYGIYLYGFPIAQALVAAFPILRGHGWAVVPVGAACTMAFAAFSWHAIEKRVLTLKKYIARKPAPAPREVALELAPSPANPNRIRS